jgi:hypothetical protein
VRKCRAATSPKGWNIEGTELSVVPKEFFVNRLRREPNGNIVKWWELYYKLVVTIQSGPMLFSINRRGKQYGAVAANY